MFNIIQKRYWYFALSALVIVPGLIAMIISLSRYGTIVKLGIDFTGGTLQQLNFDTPVQPAAVRQVFVNHGFSDTSVQSSNAERTMIIRSKFLDDQAKTAIQADVRDTIGPFQEQSFQSVGPTIGGEVTQAATIAVIAASMAILMFIWFAFRKVPNPFRYGVCAIVAELHDVLVITGLFSLAGLVLGWEADSLFLTAVLTVIGFSVQDTIVVYDRIRENVPKRRGEDYETVVNRSLLETIHRSLATQLNAIFVLIAILLFGGATMKQFVAILLIGMISGSYSSIFNASPLLVVWEKGEIGSFLRRLLGRPQRAATY
jgi:preprotein translocase SecF subunit